jgi:sugar transferase (PEP-CTERM/EpsH1 system associated)
VNSSKKYRPNIVFLTSRFPYPLEKGDKLRAYHQIKELSKTHSITLIALTDQRISKKSIESLRPLCHEIHVFRLSLVSILINVFFSLFNGKPFQTGYFYSSKIAYRIKAILKDVKPNHIICQLVRVSEYVKNYHNCPKTIDYMDALSKGMERRVKKSPFYLKWLFKSETNRLKLYEQSIFDYFENHIIISDQDREYIMHPDRKSITCIPNGIDDSFFDNLNYTRDSDLVFVGNMSYSPNIEAVQYISKEILPLLDTSNPIKLLISGANPSSVVLRLSRHNPHIKTTGWVDDIRHSYLRGKIFIAPMFIGTGMQNKLLEAMALGVPCITTPLANNAIKAIHNESILVASNAAEFANQIQSLLKDPSLYQKIALGGQEFVKSQYSWEKSANLLADLIA